MFLNIPIDGIALSLVKLSNNTDTLGPTFDYKVKLILMIIVIYHTGHFFQIYVSHFHKEVKYKFNCYYLETYIKIIENKKSLNSFSIGKPSNFDVIYPKQFKEEHEHYWNKTSNSAKAFLETSKKYNEMKFTKSRETFWNKLENINCRNYTIYKLIEHDDRIQTHEYKKIQSTKIFLSTGLDITCKFGALANLMIRETIIIDYIFPLVLGFSMLIYYLFSNGIQ